MLLQTPLHTWHLTRNDSQKRFCLEWSIKGHSAVCYDEWITYYDPMHGQELEDLHPKILEDYAKDHYEPTKWLEIYQYEEPYLVAFKYVNTKGKWILKPPRWIPNGILSPVPGDKEEAARIIEAKLKRQDMLKIIKGDLK